MAISQYFPTLNEDGSSTPIMIAKVVRGLMQGHSNSIGEITLASGRTTVLTDSRLTAQSVIILMPLTESGGNIGAYHWSDQANGTATLNHGNNVGGNTLRYHIVG